MKGDKMRYLLFGFYRYYPNGGANDFMQSFDTLEECLNEANKKVKIEYFDGYKEMAFKHDYDYFNILDIKENKKIKLDFYKDSVIIKE
jgi:hypothetical protein